MSVSNMSNWAWFHLNSKGDIFSFYDPCHKPKCKCQKQTTFSPVHFEVEVACLKNTRNKILQGAEKGWENFPEPGIKIAIPFLSAGLVAKTK